MTEPALALLEFSSVAVGVQAGDAMAKRAPVARLRAGTVQPGKYLVLVAGDVASVEEAVEAGLETGAEALVDQILLPQVHPDVVQAVSGRELPDPIEALGIVETYTAAAAILAADAGRKGAKVELVLLRLADGLGGKAFIFFSGTVADVQAAVEIGAAAVRRGMLLQQRVIPSLHPEMAANLLHDSHWRGVVRGWEGGREDG